MTDPTTGLTREKILWWKNLPLPDGMLQADLQFTPDELHALCDLALQALAPRDAPALMDDEGDLAYDDGYAEGQRDTKEWGAQVGYALERFLRGKKLIDKDCEEYSPEDLVSVIATHFETQVRKLKTLERDAPGYVEGLKPLSPGEFDFGGTVSKETLEACEAIDRATVTSPQIGSVIPAPSTTAPRQSPGDTFMAGIGAAEPKRISQTAFGQFGNCQSACLAMMIGCDLSEVPNFSAVKGDNNEKYKAQGAWLKERGLWLMTVVKWQTLPWPPRHGFYIAGGVSPRGYRHSVIYRDGEEWHDPYPEGGGIESVDDVDFVLPIGFRALSPQPGMAERTAPSGYAAGIEAAKKAAENWEPVEKLLPLCDEDANEAAMTGQWEARERIVDAIDALAATPPSMAVVSVEPSEAPHMIKHSGYWTYDKEANAYYFAPINRAAPPYLKQVIVEACLDIAKDGTLAGVELFTGKLPPPPTAAPHFKGPGPLDERPVRDDGA